MQTKTRWGMLVVLALSLTASGCSSQSPTENMGRVDLALLGTAPSGTIYRLRQAIIMVQGPSNTLFFDTEEDPNATKLSASVVAGAYTAFLQEGWHLERLAADGTATVVEAQYLSPNPQPFAVTVNGNTVVTLRFHAGPDDVTMDEGSFDLVIGVEETPVAGALCASNAECGPGQTCCLGGFLGGCYALAAGQACPLPDLTVSAEAAAASLGFTRETFSPTSCALVEGCVAAAGSRRLLNFATQTPNIGDADVVLGDPSGQPGFEFSSCHGHYHFEGYARYELVDLNGAIAATGHKQAFCLLDSTRVDPDAAPTGRFHCNFQGIQAGWSDIYGAGLDCQWVDITEVVAGDYHLRITINPDHVIPESDYSNNTIDLPVHIASEGAPGDPLSTCSSSAPNGLTRECGWTLVPGFQDVACTPGQSINLGCGGCGGGSCTGDTMLRVCAGAGACTATDAILSADDSCNTFCSNGTFVCPAGGSYTAMTTSYDIDFASTCTPVATTP